MEEGRRPLPPHQLFCLDVYFRNTTVLLSLKLADGGGATETIASRADAIVIEEIGFALEVDGASVDGEGTWRLVGDATFVVPRSVNTLCRRVCPVFGYTTCGIFQEVGVANLIDPRGFLKACLHHPPMELVVHLHAFRSELCLVVQHSTHVTDAVVGKRLVNANHIFV